MMDSNKTVRELLEANSNNRVTKLTAMNVPKKDGGSGPFILCQFCPFKVWQSAYDYDIAFNTPATYYKSKNA